MLCPGPTLETHNRHRKRPPTPFDPRLSLRNFARNISRPIIQCCLAMDLVLSHRSDYRPSEYYRSIIETENRVITCQSVESALPEYEKEWREMVLVVSIHAAGVVPRGKARIPLVF